MGLKRETDRQPKYLTPAGDRKQTDRHAVLLCFPPAGHGQKEMLQVSDVCQKKKKKEKLRRQWKPLPRQLRKRSHFGTEYRKAPPPQKGKEKSMGIKRVAGLAWNRLPMRVDNSTKKGTSGMEKFSSKVYQINRREIQEGLGGLEVWLETGSSKFHHHSLRSTLLG